MVKTIAILGAFGLVLSIDARAQASRLQDQQPRSIEYRLPVAGNDSGPSFYKRKSEWQKIIDDYWGPGDSYSRKLSVFNSFASYVRTYFPAFAYSHLNWDSVAAYWRAKITDSTSRGAFHALIGKFMYSLDEWHAYAGDNTVWATPMSPGVPVAYYTGSDARHFGAALTPMPDTSLLVYKVVPNHPLGLQPGDRILGYEGVPWPRLFEELTEAGIGTDFLTGACPSTKEYFRFAFAGTFWHLFDTVDVVKCGTGQTVHLPTAPLIDLDRSAPFLHCEQLPIPGVPMPSEDLLAGVVTYGIVEGTNVGYIYVRHQTSSQLPAQFYGAVQALENTDGLIVDLRLDYGGSYGLMPGLARLMSYGDSTLMFKKRGSATDLEALITHTGWGTDLSIPADAGTMYDRPIAVLVGPQCRSYGDISARQFTYVPGVRFFGKSPAGAYSGSWASPGFSTPGYTFECPGVIEVDHRFPDVQLLNKEFPVDEEVWLTPDGVAKGEDDVVKRALEWISTLTYAHDATVDRSYARPGLDSVCVTARLANPLGHSAALSAVVTDNAGALYDSLRMFDDGAHGDKISGDSIWGCYIRAPSTENLFSVAIGTEDITQGTSRRLPYAARFATAGPVLCVDDTAYADAHWGASVTFRLKVNNRSATTAFPAIRGTIRALDTAATVFGNPYTVGDLAPGQTRESSIIRIVFSQWGEEQQDIPFQLMFSSQGIDYWVDTLWIHVTPLVGIVAEAMLPATFQLNQNYPNPFNPSTKIRYGLPQRSHVTLVVFNTLGQQVAKLVETQEEAGYHEVRFDGSGLASGVYFYRLQAGDFVATKRLAIVR